MPLSRGPEFDSRLLDETKPWPHLNMTLGLILAGFLFGTTRHCCILNIKALDLMVSERFFLVVPLSM